MSLAYADQPAANKYSKSPPAPSVETPPLVFPYVTPKFDFSTVDVSKFRKEIPEASFDTIDLGASAMRFDVASTTTRPGGDTPDLSNVIVPLRPGKKRSNPRYFGFVLSTPTH